MNARQKAKRASKDTNNLKQHIEKLNGEITSLKYENRKLNNQTFENKTLENVLKFAITNHIGGLRGGMMIDMFSIDKMKDIDLKIEAIPQEHSYMIRVRGIY